MLKTKRLGSVFLYDCHLLLNISQTMEGYLRAHKLHQRGLFLADVLDDLLVDPGPDAALHQGLK